MGALSNYSENEILDHIMGNGAFTRPTNLYFALCKADPGETAKGSSISEPSSLYAYMRQLINGWDAAASRATANTGTLTFSQAAAGNWGTISHFAILDTSKLATGNVIAYGDMTESKRVLAGDDLSIAIGDVDISVNAGGMSDYLANKILDHLFEGTAYTPPTSIFVGLTTQAVVDADTGSTITEPSGSNYARLHFASWNNATLGVVDNSTLFNLMQATTAWTTITDYVLCDAITTGNLLLYSALTTPRNIGAADTAKFNNGDLDVSID